VIIACSPFHLRKIFDSISLDLPRDCAAFPRGAAFVTDALIFRHPDYDQSYSRMWEIALPYAVPMAGSMFEPQRGAEAEAAGWIAYAWAEGRRRLRRRLYSHARESSSDFR
jgi:hypothetical protein